MNPSPTALRWFGRICFFLSFILWPLTTIVSTAIAIKLKIPHFPRATERPALRLDSETNGR